MDVDSQVEEFDSSSSDGSDSSTSGDEQPSAEEEVSGQEENTVKVQKSRKRRRDKKRHTAGLRKTLRTHYESVEDFNPEARIAQSAEIERIRRLELQQSITSPSAHTHPPVTASHHPLHTASQEHSSPEMIVVDLSNKTSPPKDTIVIESDSGSDSDSVKKKVPPLKVGGQTTSTRGEVLHRKYDDPTVPRPDGRLIVNVNHNVNEPDIILAPQVARIVKPHQIGGIRFLYDNIIESLGRYSSSPGFGCILAHSMGLGKTLQVISFIDVFLRYTPAKHALCVVPVNTLQNWVNEFDRWLPANKNPSTSHLTGIFDTQYRTFGLFLLSESTRTMEARVKVITDWQEVGGVILIGYEMFRLLSLSVPSLAGNKMAVKRRKNAPPKAETINLDETEKEMDALIGIQRALCDPGPDLVVCDEGHRIKNDFTNISQALKRIRTRRRIVMTGYPLQNNLTEYWCMVDFVRPKYLGTKQEFADLFDRPITNGQCADSTPNDVRLMRYRSHVLHSLLEGFVLRRGHDILKSTLPPIFEHVLFLRPSEVQGILYDYNMSLIEQGGGVSVSNGPLKAFAVCTKIWNHPDIYYQEVVAQGAKDPSITKMLDEAGLPKSATSGLKVGGESSCKLDWLPSYTPDRLEHSPKMAVLVELINKSVHYRDKILVFSQSLSTLSCVERILTQRHVPLPDPGMGHGTGALQYQNVMWTKNKHYCRLDGSTSSMERDKLITAFNSPSNMDCWVFLLSTKAGCLGINLIGANRVVVLDVSWNPCYDAQAVCRVYRYGQTKPCYIYRLVCDGTMERKIYDRQISKQGMSDRVVDHLQPERHLSTQDIISLTTPLTALPPSRDLSPFAPEYLFDPVLMSLCYTSGHLLTKLPFKHESLLIDSVNERMTELEKYQALTGFQAELRALKNGPASIHEFRAMQAKSAPLPSSVPGILATPTPSLMLPAPPPMLVTPIPIISKPNEPIEIICLDSDEDDKTSSTTPPKTPPVTFEPTKAVQSSILSAQAQLYFTASQQKTNLITIATNSIAPPTNTSGVQSALSFLSKTPPTLEPSVTTEQLSEMAEGIVHSLKSQLLTSSLTRCQQDETKMAASEKKGNEPSEPGGGQSTNKLLNSHTADQSSTATSDHVLPVPDNRGQEQTTIIQAQTDGPNIHLNSNSNNAVEETNKLTIVASSAESDGVTVINKEGWRSQSEKSRKAAKKERSCSTASSWKPPYPPPPPPTTHFPPCSIPLLSPIAAHLLYISTGTKLPSSPPEDMLKYPPIVSPSPSSHAPSSPEGEMDWLDHDDETETNPPLESSNIESENTTIKSTIPETSQLIAMLMGGSKDREDNVANTKSIISQTSNVNTITTTTSVCQREPIISTTNSALSATVYPMICSPLPLRGQSAKDIKSTIGKDKSQNSTSATATTHSKSTTITVPTYTQTIPSNNLTPSSSESTTPNSNNNPSANIVCPINSQDTAPSFNKPPTSQAPSTNGTIPASNQLGASRDCYGHTLGQSSVPSKPKWIRSFSVPVSKGRASTTTEPPTSTNYDPQPILCIDNWTKGPATNEITDTENRTLAMTQSSVKLPSGAKQPPIVVPSTEISMSKYNRPNIQPYRSHSTSMLEDNSSFLPDPSLLGTRSYYPNAHNTPHSLDPNLFGLDTEVSSMVESLVTRTSDSSRNLLPPQTSVLSRNDNSSWKQSISDRKANNVHKTTSSEVNAKSETLRDISGQPRVQSASAAPIFAHPPPPSTSNQLYSNVNTLFPGNGMSSITTGSNATGQHAAGSNVVGPGSRPIVVGSNIARPSVVGSNIARPSVLGSRPNVTGARPNVTGARPNVTGARPNVTGARPNVTGARLSVVGPRSRPVVVGSGPGPVGPIVTGSNITGSNVAGSGHQHSITGHNATVSTLPVVRHGYTSNEPLHPVTHSTSPRILSPLVSSPDKFGSSYTRDFASGGACVVSSTHPQAIFRTKQTAVVSPYLIVRNNTSTDFVPKMNTETNISMCESSPLASRTQQSSYAPQKLTSPTTLPQATCMTGTKLGTSNSSNPWMNQSMSGATTTRGIAPGGRNQNLFQQNFQKMSPSYVLNTQNGNSQNGISQNGISISQNGISQNGISQNGISQNGISQTGICQNGISQSVKNNAVYRNRVQSCSDTFARTQLSPTNLPTTPQRIVTTNLSNGGHLSYNGDTLKTGHFTTHNGTSLAYTPNAISPAYTPSAAGGEWSNTQQIPNATGGVWSNKQTARRCSVDSGQNIPRTSFSHHSTHRTATPPNMTATPPHSDGVFPGAGQRYIVSVPPPPPNSSSNPFDHSLTPLIQPQQSLYQKQGMQVFNGQVSTPLVSGVPPKSSSNPFDHSLPRMIQPQQSNSLYQKQQASCMQAFNGQESAPLGNAPLPSSPAFPFQSGFPPTQWPGPPQQPGFPLPPQRPGSPLPPQRPGSLPLARPNSLSSLPNWTGGVVTPSMANKEATLSSLPSTTTQSPYRLGTPDRMGISPTPQLPRTMPNQLEISPLPQHIGMPSNHLGISPAISRCASPVRQQGISPSPVLTTSQPLLGSSAPCCATPLSSAHLTGTPPPYFGTEHTQRQSTPHTTNSLSQNGMSGNYAIPSLYGHKPRPPPRQVLSPTRPTRLPSFDQLPQGQRSTEIYCQQGYSGCHGNCRVGVATRICK